MEDYHQLKLKRKDLEDVNNDFSDFSLSSPARKIRRLDAELPPIIEEVECDIPLGFGQTLVPEQRPHGDSPCPVRIKELPSSEDKAIVLFNPALSLSVDPRLISALKNQDMRSIQPIPWRLTDEAAGSGNGCLAIVPWVPSKLLREAATEFPSQPDNSETMDVQEVEEGEGMDVEDGDTEEMNVNGVMLTQGFHQWQQQQHCLIPQSPYNATAPIVWYR